MNTQRFASVALLMISAGLLQSCGLNDSGDGPPVNTEFEFIGVYGQGIEDSWFYSCEYDEPGWKPEFNDDSFDQLMGFWEDNDQNFWALTKITVRGVVSKKGNYSGFFARYEREILILEILEAEFSDDTEC